jgi:acylphosphatase
MLKSFQVTGRVQGVMFRQTFIRACVKRKIHAGATNHPDNRNLVTCTIESDDSKTIDKLVIDLEELNQLNSWGAHVDSLKILEKSLTVKDHEVTTDNVDNFNWSSGVTFFL